jgi:hypothetical protein
MMRRLLLTLACVCLPLAASAQTHTPPFYTLEIVNMDPASTNGATADARRFRAYPGIEYNIRVAAGWGVYPYTYALSGEPAGMTINVNTGEITWPNPTTDDPSITVTVTDAASATDSATWGIDVTTTGFVFVDAVNGVNASNNGCASSCGTGTLAAPWRTFLDLVLNDAVADITYFRAGTYQTTDAAAHASGQGDGGPEQQIQFSNNSGDATRRGSTQWIGYPGETAIIDFGGDQVSTVDAWSVRLAGTDVYVDDLTGINATCLGWQFEGGTRGPEFRRLILHDLGPGGNGFNCAFLDTRGAAPNAAYGMVIADSVMSDLNIGTNYDAAVVVKIYSQNKLIIANNTMSGGLGMIHLKQDARQYDMQANTIAGDVIGIGGNMDDCLEGNGCEGALETTYGQMVFNNISVPTTSSSLAGIDLNQAGESTRTHVFRNTVRGYVRFRSTEASSTDGPFYITRNVLIGPTGNCGGSHTKFTCDSVTDISRFITSNNLEGVTADGIVDANGNLQGSYLTDHGPDSALPKGHMLGDAEEPPPSTATATRLRFRVPE